MPRRNYGMAHPSLVRDAVENLDTRVAVLEDNFNLLMAEPAWQRQSVRLDIVETIARGLPSNLADRLRALEQAEDRRQQPALGQGAPMPAPHQVLTAGGERLTPVYCTCPGYRCSGTCGPAQARSAPPPPADPRIDHLCWVWDSGPRPDQPAVRRINRWDPSLKRWRTATGESWKHAELVRPEEL